jgi:hypothetical protein
LVASPAIEESSDSILHFGGDIRVAQGAKRIDSFPVSVQKKHTIRTALQMLFER